MEFVVLARNLRSRTLCHSDLMKQQSLRLQCLLEQVEVSSCCLKSGACGETRRYWVEIIVVAAEPAVDLVNIR